MLCIVNVKRGAETAREYRGRLLYAEVINEEQRVVCAATLGDILLLYANNRNIVINYHDMVKRYLKFNEDVMHEMSNYINNT